MAKTGLMKKYIKSAGGDFKKAWKLQKAAKKGKKKPVKKKIVRKKPVKKKATKKRLVKKVVKKVIEKIVKRKTLKRRKAVGNMAKRKKATPKRRRKSGGGKVDAQKILMQGVGAAAGAIGAGVVANMIPLPDPRMKAALPIVAGVVLGMSKMGRTNVMKSASVGMISAGALALVRQLAPKVPLLAGEDQEMLDYVPGNDEELALLGYDEENYDDFSGSSVDLDGESVEVAGESENVEEMDGEFMTTADI